MQATPLQPPPPGAPVPAAEPTASPAPPRLGGRVRRSRALAVGALVVAGTAYTAVVDPNTSHAFPLCPLKLVTGLDCPLCGSLRAVHALAHGRVLEALGHNALFVASVPYLVAFWVMWLLRDLGSEAAPTLRLARPLKIVGLVVVAAFTVTRNLPVEPLHWLNSTAS